MGFFTPEFDGQLTVGRLPDDFAARIQRRVDDGLFMPGRRDRANYRVTSIDHDTVSFVAEGLLTIYNIGLNEVTVRRGGRNQVQYHVSYRGWAMTAVAHGGILGLAFVLCYALIPRMRADIASYPFGLAMFACMVGFFGIAWPWIMTAFHRRFAERELQRILGDALSGAPTGRAAA